MKEKLSLIGVLVIIAGVAFATARLVWSSKNEPTESRREQRVLRESASLAGTQASPDEQGRSTHEGLEGGDGDQERAGFENKDTMIAGEKIEYQPSAQGEDSEILTVREPIIDSADTNEGIIFISQEIKVDTPTAHQVLTSPFRVQGASRLQEVHIHVTNKAGTVLLHEHAPVSFARGQEWGAFRWDITYEFSGTKEGSVRVLADDNAPHAGFTIPVTYH